MCPPLWKLLTMLLFSVYIYNRGDGVQGWRLGYEDCFKSELLLVWRVLLFRSECSHKSLVMEKSKREYWFCNFSSCLMEAYNQAILNVCETILVHLKVRGTVDSGVKYFKSERNEVCFKFVNPGTVIVTIIIICQPRTVVVTITVIICQPRNCGSNNYCS